MGDLVKWRGDAGSSLEQKIERWRRSHVNGAHNDNGHDAPLPVVRDASPPALPLLAATDSRLDLPRICAVTRKLWAARYLRNAGQSFDYIRSVIPDGRIRLMLYRPEDVRLLPDFEAGIEDCPHCGAYTPDTALGSVWCGACRSWVCFGLTSREGLFTCACGNRGALVADRQTPMGVVLR